MGRSKPPTQSAAPGRKADEQIKENSSRKINKFIKKQQQPQQQAKPTKSTAGKLNAMQMDPPGGRRRVGRALKDHPTPESESSSSPVDADSSNDANSSSYGGPECRRSSRKKTIKFDVRDLLNKNRKSHKIQIEARIDSNAPKLGAGQASKEELDSKQKTFIEKSAIFRRFSISENKMPPRLPPPPVALIQTIQQCVGELEQLPLDGDIDLATISPIARRLSRTQEILTASMMKPKQVNSLIVTKLESASSSRGTLSVRGRVGRPRLSETPAASTVTQQKRRGRPPKFKMVAESSDSTVDSSNDSFDTNEPAKASCNSDCSSPVVTVKPEEDTLSNGRQVSVSPDSSTKGIDLKEMLDASAVTLPQPTILDDCMLVSTDDLFVAAEEEVFTEALSSDESTVTLRVSPNEKNVDEISLFARSDSTETNSSDDSERRRKKVRVSVKRVALPSPIKERTELSQKNSSSEDKSAIIEIYSSNDDDSLTCTDVKGPQEVVKVGELGMPSSSRPTRAGRKKQVESCSTVTISSVEGENSNSTTVGSIVEISSDSATPVDELLGISEKTRSPNLRLTRTRQGKSCKRGDDEKVEHFNLSTAIGKQISAAVVPLQISKASGCELKESDASTAGESAKAVADVKAVTEQNQPSGPVSLRKRRNAPQQIDCPLPSPTNTTVLLKDNHQLSPTSAAAPRRSRRDAKEKETFSQSPPTTPELSKTTFEPKEVCVLKQNVSDTQKATALPEQTQGDDQTPTQGDNIRIRSQASEAAQRSPTSSNRKDAQDQTVLGLQSQGDDKEESFAPKESQASAHVALRSRNQAVEVGQRSPTSKTRKGTQDQSILGLQSQATTLSEPKMSSIPTKEKQSSTESYSSDTPSHEGVPQREEIAFLTQNDQTVEIQSSVEPEITKNEATTSLSKATEQSPPQTKADVPSSGRRGSLRAGTRTSESLQTKSSSKKISKTSPKLKTSTTDRASTSSDSSEGQDSTSKNRRQVKTNILHKDNEETSNMCSDSSLLMSYLSSLSSSSSLSTSSSSSTSSWSSTSSSQLRATRSRKAQQPTQEENLETEVDLPKSPRVTPPRKPKSDSRIGEAKTSTSASRVTKKSRKLEEQFTEPDSEGSENADTKSPAVTKISRKSEEQYTEPDSESSENSAKHCSQPSTIEKDSGVWLEERAKLMQRRKSARLNRWASALEKDANETGSESSETSPRTRAGRSRGRGEVTVKAQPLQSPVTASNQTSLSESSSKTGDKAVTKDVYEFRTENSLSSEDTCSPKKVETVSKLKEFPKSTLEEPVSEPTPTSPKIPLHKEQVDEASATEEKKIMSPKEVSIPSSKPKKRNRKFVSLKSSSSESNALSDDETSAGGTLSRTLPRNTRARRKTISNEIELEAMFTTNLSPPDKALEYSSPKSRKTSADAKVLRSPTDEVKNSSETRKEIDYKDEAIKKEVDSSGLSEDLDKKHVPTSDSCEIKANQVIEDLKIEQETQVTPKEVNTNVSATLELEKTPVQETIASTSADVLKPELGKISRQRKGTRFSPANPDNVKNDAKPPAESSVPSTNLEVDTNVPMKISKEGSVSTSEGPEGSTKISRQKRKTTATQRDPDTQSALSKPAANDEEADVSETAKPGDICVSTEATVEKGTLDPASSTKSEEITEKHSQTSVEPKSSSTEREKSENEACPITISHETSDTKPSEDAGNVLELDTNQTSNDCPKSVAGKVIAIESTVKEDIAQLSCTPTSMSGTEEAAEKDLTKEQSTSTSKAVKSLDEDAEKKVDSLGTAKLAKLVSEEPTDNTAEVVSAMGGQQDVPTKEPEQDVQAMCLEKTQPKKEKSPRTKKKSVPQQQQSPKASEEGRKPKNIKNIDAPPGKDVDFKSTSSESNHSDDSLKVEAQKTEPKPIPRRQLDSSFIESLEKSLLRPVSGKKSSKKKDKEPNLTPSPRTKEETKKSKKVQETQEQKKLDTSSPRPKKKQKDAPKVDKKPDEDISTKRKSLTKIKEPDAVKPLEPDPPKNEPKNSTDASTDKTSVEIPCVPSEVIETPDEAPKLLKSKGETKFYADESLTQPIQSQPLTIAESPGIPAVEKEKSPDLLPDPLKDIEKFIEDGVNLLKRGYKLGDDDETALDRDILKSDELMTPKKCKLDETNEEKKESPTEDDNSNSNSECSTLATTPTSEVDTPNGIRRSHRIKNNSKSTKCLVGRGLVRDKERFSLKDDEKTIYSIDDQKMDLAEVEAKNSQFLKDMEERLSNFRVIRENEYKCERVISKEAKRMLCDCFLTPEEEERGELGCGEDCLNRLLMIECGSDCTVRDRCTNRRFTKFLYSPCRVFRTEKKGFGIMADIEILPGEFIMEYVGEVINGDEFEFRRNAYSQDKNKHYYFMALRSDAIIDATAKGNISRFINHSCDPNAETQKWTVNGELRIGFFSRKSIMPGEEITFDYQYQRYGKEAQKCYCESSNCRGWIGEEPSSEEEEEEEEELDGYEDGESEESEEEEEGEDQPVVPMPVPAPVSPSIIGDDQFVPAVSVVSEVSALDKDTDDTGKKVVSPTPVPTPITVESPIETPKEVLARKKKERKRIDRKEDKIKRRETKQFLEDPDIEDEVRFLVKCGLKNQADTLRLSRLIVRAKLLGTRLKLLQILRKGELPCRRLFLDYHGLRLLHGWMSEVIDTRDTDKSMEIRMVLLSVLECLPISNKTMLTDSKVYQTVRDWSNNKESHSPSDSPKDTNACDGGSEDASSELQKLAAKLVNTWDNLPEVFRIPKRERIEQMKEHEREADRQYKGLGDDVSRSDVNRNRERFMRITGPNSSRFKWSRGDKDKERERATDRRKYTQNGGSCKDGNEKTACTLPGDSQLSKEQRRELFAAKVARDEAEKRLAEERREFDIKCRFFGLDPKRMRPENMPFCVNPSTGQWYSTDKKPISTPPSYAHVQVPVKPKSTNPSDYRLPEMDLPPLWKFAISPKGKIYYYHVKIRIPQWEPPIKILPLAGQNNLTLKNSESDSSNADCVDSSEDDIEVIKGLDPVKLRAYIEKKIEDRRLQRYTRLVEEKPISPRKEEDRIYNQMEVRKYKENKEKIRKRKEEIRRKRDSIAKGTPIDSSEAADTDADAVDAIPIQDYLLSSDEEDIKAECDNSPLIDKIVQGDKIVDELDALQSKRPLKRPLPIREKHEHKKRKLEKGRDSNKSTKRSKDGENSGSSKYRKIREKFRCEIAGIIVQHLKPYRKETCPSGRILTDEDFNHLARKLTHFVMVKELKYCESIGQTLVVTESVKNKSREFIKKYMAKYGEVYVRPKNDPEFKEIPFL